ncbi:hypothetical protein SAMN02746073_2169 [Legionella jamestowniensis DSM 19215]|uniref:hypothetical protein n=1 Tax=Legionella jamestowniensis TaxID=455 RepID=UPI0008E466D8|nr:hypothetical protein [Legionella jamestowniensis]SFL83813.1 hypothetical protein SAMN02746073_2169 [Legionella jamestowniensis DSM 19215]
MPSDLDLFKQYCMEGRSNEVKTLVERAKKTDPLQVFPIDIPAKFGQLEIVKYLFETQNVDPSNILYGLLFHICSCNDETKRRHLLNWLLENDRYKRLGEGISEAHLQAALGLPYNHLPAEAHRGLYPIHYASLVGSKNLLHCSTDELNKPITSGDFEGITPFYLLVLGGCTEVVSLLVKKGIAPKSLNTCSIKNVPGQELTLAYILASSGNFNLLNYWDSQTAEAINLNAGPTHPPPPKQGESLGLLLCLAGQIDLFSKFVKKNPQSLSLSKTVLQGPNKGWNIAYALACLGHFDVLSQLVKNSPEFIDLNTEYEGKKGKTLGWILAFHSQKDLLIHLSQDQKETLNLNTAPPSEPNKEVSLAALLADLNILDQFVKQTRQPVNLHARTTQGKTLFQQLVASNRFELIDTILDVYLEQPNCEELMTTVFNKHNTLEGNSLRLRLAMRCYEKIKDLLSKKEELGNTLNTSLEVYLAPFLKHINAISQNLPDYKEAQSLKGHLYLTLAEAYEADNRINLHPQITVNSLYASAVIAFTQAANTTMNLLVFMRQRATITALRDDNKKHQSTIATLQEESKKRPLPTAESSISLPSFSFFDSLAESAKRRRVEDHETPENKP